MKNLHMLAFPRKQALKLSQSWHMLWSCTQATMPLWELFSSLPSPHPWICCWVNPLRSSWGLFEVVPCSIEAIVWPCLCLWVWLLRCNLPSRWYGWSPHFFDLSCCCLCIGLTSGLHVRAIRMDREEYSGKFVFYISWSVLTFQVGHGVLFSRRFLLWYLLIIDKSSSISQERFNDILVSEWQEDITWTHYNYNVEHTSNGPCLWGAAGLYSIFKHITSWSLEVSTQGSYTFDLLKFHDF